jgi:hypothetical protein
MKYAILTLTFAVLLLVVSGCERKIVNEVSSEPPPGQTAACFTCHSDSSPTGQLILEAQQSYSMSVHGTGENWNRNRVYSSRYQVCEGCHTNEGFVARMTGVPYDGEYFSRIGCFTCHKPHSSGSLQPRVTSAVTLLDGTVFDRENANTCASCHHARENVNTFVPDLVANDDTLTNHWGPHHSVQADMLMGTDAYEYSGVSGGPSPHGSAADGCLHCHMAPGLYSTGFHAFNMADEAQDYENTNGCNTTNGCHAGTLDSLGHDGVQADVEVKLEELAGLLYDAGLLEWVKSEDGTDSTLEPTSGRHIATVDSAGAVYNYLFVHEDRSLGVHNPDYTEELLDATISFMTPKKSAPGLDPLAAH